MDTNTINKMYDNMLKAADSLESGKELSKEDISNLEEISSTVNNIDNIVLDNNSLSEPKAAIGSYDPVTGDVSVSNTSDDNIIKKISDKQFDLFTKNNDGIEIDNSVLSKLFSARELEEITDIEVVSKLIKMKMNGGRIKFDDLPGVIKTTVICSANQDGHPVTKTTLNAIADLTIESLVTEYKKNAMTTIDIDAMLSGFDKDMKDMQNTMSKDIGKMLIGTDITRKAEIDAAIERCKSEGKTDSIKKLEKMKSSIDDAYNLDKFSEFCKKVKIKNFDLEKPKRVTSSFNSKYEKHVNNINDINACPMILDRHLKDDPKSNLKVCLAFCKYCMNMSPDNVEEHTFMYYFIRNIITIDRLNPKGLLYDSMKEEEKAFYDGFLSNINKCIENLNNR